MPRLAAGRREDCFLHLVLPAPSRPLGNERGVLGTRPGAIAEMSFGAATRRVKPRPGKEQSRPCDARAERQRAPQRTECAQNLRRGNKMRRNTVLLLSGLLLAGMAGISVPAVAETASEEIDEAGEEPGLVAGTWSRQQADAAQQPQGHQPPTTSTSCNTSGRSRPARCAATRVSRSSSSTTASR